MSGGRPLRVLLVGDYPNDPRLGSAKVLLKLREELAALGHTCDTLFADDLGPRPRGRQWRQLAAPALAYRAIAKRSHATPYDVVDVSSAEGMWIGIARRLGRWKATACISRSHGLEHLNYQRMLGDDEAGLLRKPWTRRIWYPVSRLSQVALAARFSDGVIVLNEADRKYAIDKCWQPAARVHLVPHGVSTAFLDHPADAAATRGKGALFCGTWDLMKGITYLTAAWDRLAFAGHQIPLTVMGPGVSPDTVRAAFADRARPLVRVVERAPEAAVMQAYRQHDMLVFPSTYEGFGLVVLEAMSQGLPVVATPVGCAGTLVVDGRTGRLVAPRDADAVADAVRELMADAVLRQRLGDNARAAVRSMSWRNTAAQTERVYRSVLAEPA